MRKFLSWVLCGAMALGMVPAFTLEAEATEVDVKAETLESFGFDLDNTALQEVIDSSETPYGDYTFSLYSSEELAWTYGQEAQYYDTLKSESSDYSLGSAFTSSATYYPFAYGVSYISAVDFSADQEDGRDKYVAYYYASVVESSSEGNYTNLYLTIVNSETGVSWERSMGRLPFELEATYAEGFLAIEAGDYDGDGEDELAIYVPTNADEDGKYGSPIIAFYEVNATTCEAYYSKNIDLSGGNLDYGHAYDFSGVSKIDEYTWENIKEFPIVDLTAIEQYGSDADDLAVVINYTRDVSDREVGNKYDDSYSSLYRSLLYIYKDYMTNSSDSEIEHLQWNWNEYGVTDTNKTGYTEAMMFAGSDAGDITGDGYYNELVVGGYRLENYNDSNDNLSQDEYLVTYFNYDATTDSYSVASVGQWISLDDEEYEGATDIDGGIRNSSDRFSTAYSPLQVTAFAERGTGFADSVLVGELVLALGSTTDYGYSTGSYPSLYTAPENDLITGISAFSEVALAVRFALPTKDYDEDDSCYDALITDAVAGNFMNSSDGKEQLYYTYVVRRSSDSYNTYVGGIGNVGTGDNDVMNTDKLTFTGDNIVRFSSTGLGWQVDNATVSLAAPDRDWDGMLMRYTDTSPEYYFSDPHVLAVLQAAPYFGELVNAEYTEDTGSTTISYTEGSSGAVDSSISINASISFGFKSGFNFGVDITNIKYALELGITAGWTNTTESSQSYTVSYSAVATDTVVLVMTPYIRYNYEVWDSVAGEWSAMAVDIPQTPQITQITVDDYDKVAATNDDLDTIRDNLLYDSTPGDPSTYAVTAPDGYSSGQVVGADGLGTSGYMTLGTAGGGISMSISSEKSVSNGLTWGASISYGTEVDITGAYTGYTAGASYDGGYTWTSMSGVEFEGEVADISSEFASDYSFQWLFGSRTAELNDEECVVLSYVVKNVTALPRSPLSLDIVGTDTDSLTLSWDGEGVDPEYYVVYRYLSDYDMYYAIGTVAGDDYDTNGLYEYTDTDCDPDTTYEYAVKAFGYSSGVLRSGIYSPIASGHTNPDGDTVIQITTQPTNAEIRSGKSATFTIGVTPAPGGGDVSYIWQSYSSSDGWSNVDTTSGSTLTIADQTEDNDGDKYRCIIMQKVGTTIYTLYSNTVSVDVGLGETTTTLEIRDSSGAVTATGEASATTTTATPVYSDVAMMVSVNGVGYSVYQVVELDESTSYYLVPTSGSDVVYGIPNDDLSDAIDGLIADNEINKNYSTAALASDSYDVEEITQVQYFYKEDSLTTSTDINNLDDKTVETVEGGTEIEFETEAITSYIKYEFDGGTVIYQMEDDTAGTLYYLYNSANNYTQIYLGSVTLVNESDATQTTPDYKAVNLIATSYTYSTIITRGETMTLCAKVSEDGDSTATTDGYVTFVITNNETKESTSLTSALSSGACTASWSPSVAGTYSIVANYAGSSYFSASSSDSSDFTTYQAGYSLTLTSAAATMAIGQGQYFELTPTLNYTTIASSTETIEKDIDGVTYTITNNTTGESTTTYSADAVYKPTLTAVGSYTVVAAVDLGEYGIVTATAGLTLTKNTVTITVNSATTEKNDLSGFNWDTNVTYEITGTPWVWDGTEWVDKTSDLKAMIEVMLDTETVVTALNVGSYTIYPTITDTDTDTYNAILAMNNITTQSSTLSVTAPKYAVSFSANTGGDVTGIIDTVVPITSGALVTEGSSVTVEAIPATGYTVNYWTVDGTILRGSDNGLITSSTQSFSVEDDVALQVSFKVGSNNLTYSVATGSESFGALTANETNANGVAVNSGDAIATSQAVYFTATPEEGYEVSGWTVNGDTVLNADGTSYLNQTYTLSGMTASTDVQVSFAEISSYSVTTMAMDGYGNEIGSVSINVAPDENGNYPINSALVLTANKPSASYTVQEWRIYEDGGAYTTVNSTSTTYAISSLQSDMDIRVIFVSLTTYDLWYSIDNGTISATTGDGIPLTSGYVYDGGIPVTITATPATGYQVTAVTANGTDLQLQTGDIYNESTYLLEALTENTTITVTTAEYEVADAPTASLATGSYTTAQTVNLYTSDADGVIYYSINDDSDYAVYTQAIEIDSTTTIYAYVNGTYLQPSDTATFTYTIAPELVSIVVTEQPTTTSYETGANFSTDGMVVTATDTLGDTEAVTGYTVTPSTFYTAGEAVTVTISYTENDITKTATLDVTVTEAETPPTVPEIINLVSITTPDGLSFDYGVIETEILAELPATVEMLLSNGTTVDATVIWTASTNYDNTLDSYQSFTISGTATLPEDVTETQTDNLNVTITISVVGAPVPVTFISISPDTLTLYYDEILETGNTSALTATILPSNAANQVYHWSSTDSTVATVDENGQVTAMGVGVVTITATTEDGNLTASCTVTVEQVQYQVISTDLNNPTAQETLATELLTQLDVATLSEDVYYQEVTLQFSTDGGDNWTTATAENFPDEGITFTLDYPTGHDKDSDYDYVILHQISDGNIEVLTYKKVDAGLQVTVYSLSPFAVAWTDGADDSGGGSIGGGSTSSGSSDTTGTTEEVVGIVGFLDVNESDYYYDAVEWAEGNGVTSGTTATTFSPYDITTRAQAVTFLWRSMLTPEAQGDNPFVDVVDGMYYSEAVLWAVNNGITKGTSDTTFSPDMDCTRAHIITFLWRMMGEPVVTEENPFTDVGENDYYYNAVLWAVSEGITSGTTATTFSPHKDCTRAEIVTFLYRTLGE